MTDADLTLTIPFTREQIEAIDHWIARHDDPKPTREDAVRQLVAGRLGAYGPSTIIPQFTTGRDIV
ncbi:hypothetical protein [uncultured Sphingomonas sp.]|uniref:hypothetical protein n=1 Tax=uncultured Sphingomonas sp. TaxID=158754 RepID=UPI0025F0409E|nr:hypothetical protein [uncultured Sphingomonas sp.]